MEQHPIPQQISSYEFRLVGSMTLKQFGKLAAGLVIAFIIYASGLPFLLKWPLAIIAAAIGFALAFVPINERPFEVWATAFIKSVFSPTLYLWEKSTSAKDISLDNLPSQAIKEEPKEEKVIISENKEPQINEFVQSLPTEKQVEPEIETFPPETGLPVRPTPISATAEAEFGEIPMPKPPTTPNVIVGMVTDGKGKILENVIVEIQDQEGNPARALRTNQIGQFRTTAPLPNGEYLVISEKESYQFDIIKIKARGQVIPPLRIKAKKVPN